MSNACFDALPIAHLVIDNLGFLAAANSKARSTFSVAPMDIGKPLQDLEVSYRPLELRSLIEQAQTTGDTVLVNRVQRFANTGRSQTFDVFVTPLMFPSNNYAGCTIQFHDVSDLCRLQDQLVGLNQQLQTANEELQAAHEELETTNEELQSTNEELHTTNEELQSTNEELETMNEELHSSNSELEFTNAEQRQLTAAASQNNAFLEAILGSMQSALMAVNDHDQVIVWSQRCTELWGLRKNEAIGKRLEGLDIGLPTERLSAALKAFRDNGDTSVVSVDALDKTGKPLGCVVRLTPLTFDSQHAIILVIDTRSPVHDKR